MERKVVPPEYLKNFKYPEVLFPNEFITNHPWGAVPDKFPVDVGIPQVPIYCLVHVTHNAEAGEIRRDANNYEFKARQKFGKVLGAYDGRPCGESFRPSHDEDELKFVQIRDNETLFPGFYSWWGIHPSQEKNLEIESKLYVADYLKTKLESRYGNNAFVCNFQNILAAYARSRGTEVANICLRNGGTLRYTQEICYVIIISTGNDEEVLKDYDPLPPKSGSFQTNGLTSRNGKIKNPAATPTFSPQHVVSWFKDTSEPYSYETITFALYFPRRECSMQIRKQSCSTMAVSHKAFCIKKQPPPQGGKWVCPNDL